MEKPLYKKLFQRRCPLAFVELWYAGEKSDARQWTSKNQVSHPYVVVEHSGGIETVFFGSDGIDWIKRELLSRSKKDPQFAQVASNTFLETLSPILDILKNDKALPLSGLEAFGRSVRDAWPWFEAVWWFIDALEETGRKESIDMKRLQAARKAGELFFPNGCSVVKKSLEQNYSGLGQLSSVLLWDEALSGKIPSKPVLEKRLHHYIYTDGRLFTEKALSDVEKEFGIAIEAFPESAVTMFKGQTAFPGVVTGRIRKIIDRSQTASFQNGEILLAPSTMPDLLPAMKKAGAIVSDEGGLISHTAIVARELKKPCIIGTRFAFDLLNDGDLVEVNATAGFVKKIG